VAELQDARQKTPRLKKNEALQLEISKVRDCLDHAYVQRGSLLGDLSDADLRDASGGRRRRTGCGALFSRQEGFDRDAIDH
jgi:hypothetical protein